MTHTTTTLRFWHQVKDSKGDVQEQHLTSSNKSKFSMKCLAEIINGTYEIIEQPQNY